MPKNQSRKRVRDDATVAGWGEHPDSAFVALGLSREQVVAAQRDLVGTIVMPWDTAYDDTRMLSNVVFDPTPVMIVRCATEADVTVALRLAAGSNLPFTVRSGGHCTAGFSGGFGVMIDVKALDSITIDTASMRAVVGTGCDMATLNQALELHGVHVPGGECDDVCVGGFVQGGGLGFTSTSFGMSCDNVVEARVMLADGSIIVANAGQNADLLWALCGGTGGNFGVLLTVTFRLRPLGQVGGFSVAWRIDSPAGVDQAVAVMQMLQQQWFGANDPFDGALNLQVLMLWQTIVDPTQPPLPAAVCTFMVRGLWTGDPARLDSVIAPLQKMDGAVLQFTLVDSYVKVLDALLGNPQDQPVLPDGWGMPNEEKQSRYVAQDLTADQWSSIVTYFSTKSPDQYSYAYLEVYGGAINALPIETNAFVHRTSLYDAVLDVFWYRPIDRPAAEAFLAGWVALLDAVGNGEVYQNYPSLKIEDYPLAYWGSALAGLVGVKQKYDPTGRFAFAQQVPRSLPPDAPTDVPPLIAAALATDIDRRGGTPAPPGVRGG